jgi:hypothetical protein
MSIARLSLSLAGVVGLLTVAFTAAVVWLLVTQPVTTAETAAPPRRARWLRWCAPWRAWFTARSKACSSTSSQSERLRNRQSVKPSIHLNGVLPVL